MGTCISTRNVCFLLSVIPDPEQPEQPILDNHEPVIHSEVMVNHHNPSLASSNGLSTVANRMPLRIGKYNEKVGPLQPFLRMVIQVDTIEISLKTMALKRHSKH